MARSLGLPFVAVLAIWLGARLAFFNGYYTEDAPGYVGDAIAIATGDYQARTHVNGLNVGTYAPVAIPLLLFGKTDLALSVWPLTCSLLGLLSITGIAALLFGKQWGVAAALLYATYPGDVFFSTVVMPDAIQSGWLSFSLLLALAAMAGPRQREGGMLLAAGAAMGVCHLIRANGALLLPIGLAAIAIAPSAPNRARVRETFDRGLAFLAGWCLVFLVEGLTYRWAVGDFLFRFHVVDQHYGSAASIAQWGLNVNPLTIPYSTLPPLTWWRFGGWLHFNPDQAYHGLLFLLAVIAVLVGVLVLAIRLQSADRPMITGFAFALIWFSWPLAYHQFGSQSLTEFIPIHRLSRHLVVYAPGAIVAVIAGSALLWELARQRRRQSLVLLVAVPVLLVHLALNIRAERVAYDGYHRIKDTYSRIRAHLPAETTTLIADPGDLGFFDFWLNPLGESRVQLHPFAVYASCENFKNGVVLTYSNPGWENLGAQVIRDTVARLPCLLDPPARWRLLYGGYPERVYVVQ